LEFLKGDIMKPLAKSLHTVTVLVRVALNEKHNTTMSNGHAVCAALAILGLTEQPDSYGLAEQAIKQLNKFS
jgi:hypothetical protein